MNLEEFITEGLKQIINGVKNSRNYAQEKGAKIVQVPDQQKIEFDIAVTIKTTEGKQTDGKEGIFVASAGAETRGQSGLENIAASRIKFYVPITLASQDGKIEPEFEFKSSGKRKFSGNLEGY